MQFCEHQRNVSYDNVMEWQYAHTWETEYEYAEPIPLHKNMMLFYSPQDEETLQILAYHLQMDSPISILPYTWFACSCNLNGYIQLRWDAILEFMDIIPELKDILLEHQSPYMTDIKEFSIPMECETLLEVCILKQECPVCMVEDDESAVRTSCKHEFHEECLTIWLNDNNTCPLCRTNL